MRLTLTAGGDGATYTLRGYLVASREKRGAKISYIWDVADAKGERVTRVSGDETIPRSGSDPWSGVDSAVLRRIAENTTSQIAASMSGRSSRPVASKTKHPERTSGRDRSVDRSPQTARRGRGACASSFGGSWGREYIADSRSEETPQRRMALSLRHGPAETFTP